MVGPCPSTAAVSASLLGLPPLHLVLAGVFQSGSQAACFAQPLPPTLISLAPQVSLLSDLTPPPHAFV